MNHDLLKWVKEEISYYARQIEWASQKPIQEDYLMFCRGKMAVLVQLKGKLHG